MLDQKTPEQRGQCTFYRSWLDATLAMKKQDAGQYILAVIKYALDGEEPTDLKGAPKAAFIAIKPSIDNGRRKAAAGKKGGESKPEKGEVIMPDMGWASEPVLGAVNRWLSHKTERHEGYKQAALNAFIAKIEEAVAIHGEAAVIDIIDESIANGWKGVSWGGLTEKRQPTGKGKARTMAAKMTERVQAGTAALGPMEKEAIARMLKCRDELEDKGAVAVLHERCPDCRKSECTADYNVECCRDCSCFEKCPLSCRRSVNRE